jgi:hypothetical protein
MDPHLFELLDLDPDLGRQKMTHKNRKMKEFSYFEVLGVLF